MILKQDLIEASNKRVFKFIAKEIKENRKGISKLFINNLSREEVGKIKTLRFKNINMENLDFLKYFSWLETIELDKINGLKDIEGIKSCIDLKNFEIYNTYIGDFSPLLSCKKLESFDYLCSEGCEYCQKADFKFLKNFRCLYQVDLSGNKVRDVSFLTECLQLQQLVLERNPLSSIAPLKKSEKLEWLEIQNCGLCELEDIEEFPSLVSLLATENEFDGEHINLYKAKLKHLKDLDL